MQNLKQKEKPEGRVIFIDFAKRKVVSRPAEAPETQHPQQKEVTDKDFHEDDDIFLPWSVIGLILFAICLQAYFIYEGKKEINKFLEEGKIESSVPFKP